MCDCCYYSLCLFFFKQKTAYDLRISDWSSDVCSSVLRDVAALAGQLRLQLQTAHARHLHVGVQAGGGIDQRRGEKGLGRGEAIGGKAERTHQTLGGGADRRILVDDGYDLYDRPCTRPVRKRVM